jgi:hypothetical protein
MNTDRRCGLAEMRAVPFESFFDVDLFEFSGSLGQKDVSVKHFAY